MRTVRRLFYRDILSSVGFVAIAFLALFYFIDFVDGLDSLGRKGRAIWHVALAAAYQIPSHFYDLFPIAVLIGTIYALARMAQASEYTILRTSGLGPGRALGLLAALGAWFGALTLLFGDVVAPVAERAALQLEASFDARNLQMGGAGAWLKDKTAGADGVASRSIHVGALAADGSMSNVRVFEFDADGLLINRLGAERGRVAANGTWTLEQVQRTHWPHARTDGAAVLSTTVPSVSFATTLDPGVVSAALLTITSMSTLELWRYSRHLDAQAQATQAVQVQFWKKALYPLACLVMVALALPFAYLHARAGGVSLKVFGGIMLGIVFVLLNNLAGHIGALSDWTPWLVAAAPSALFLLLSMAAFAWLVRYR